MGWSITAIQHLGRWASAAVLGYVEEALAEAVHGARPSYLERVEVLEEPMQALAVRLAAVEKDISKLRKKNLDYRRRAEEAEAALLAVEAPEPPARRWVLSDNGRLHREASVQAELPDYCWRTGCGWSFARLSGYVFLSQSEAEAHPGPFCKRGCDLT